MEQRSDLAFQIRHKQIIEFDIQLKADAGPADRLRSGPGKSTWRLIANV
jgi:hypothetical protein